MNNLMKPCPFCGGIAELKAPGYEHYSPCWCKCTRCGAEGPTKSSESEAEKGWNERAQDDVEHAPTISGWISVKDRLPPNADHPGSFCPRYQVITKYGVTEGWYNPDKGCWYVLVWFLIGRYTEDDIDMERGDIPKISNNIEVTHWMMFPSAEGLDET